MKFTVVSLWLIFSLIALPSSATAKLYDLIVVGAGSGGTSAAIQAARMGASVAIVEETSWLGGQITASAVSTMDDVRHNRSGIYKEFIEKIRDYYSKTGTKTNICYWGSDTISTEPSVAMEILKDMIEEATTGKGNIHIFFGGKVTDVIRRDNKIEGVIIEKDGKNLILRGDITVDATECGDVIPMTGARYRAGNSIYPNIDLNAEIQDITWVAVIKKYDTVPEKLTIKAPPEGYMKDYWRFKRTVSPDGSRWPGVPPFDEASYKAYRALPDRSNKDHIDGGEPETWSLISKTSVNWGNDFPASGKDYKGLTVRYLEDIYYRERVNQEALMRTLRLIYYLNDEVHMDQWTVDNEQGYDLGIDGPSKRTWLIPRDYTDILAHFPSRPYVRESRRIVGTDTMTAKTIARDAKLGRATVNRKDAIALAEYPIDVHGSRLASSLELDLRETSNDFPSGWNADEGVFQVTYGTLIPEKVNGFMAAEKNISVSRLVNGATRLQPITMLTGQAVGATSAICSKYKIEPRNLPTIIVQDALLAGKSRLSLYNFRDINIDDPNWRGIQGSVLREYISPFSDKLFGGHLPMDRVEIKEALKRASGETIEISQMSQFPTRNEFFSLLEDVDRYMKKPLIIRNPEGPVTRGEVARYVWNLAVHRGWDSINTPPERIDIHP